MEETVLNIINTVLTNRSKQKMESITPEMHLRNDIGFDSLDLAELTVLIEAEYDVDIFEDGLVNTIEEVYAKIDTN